MDSPSVDGGPAFPITGGDEGWDEQGGMSLRDYFAAHAMQGWLSSGDGLAVMSQSATECGADDLHAHVARVSYLLADAMLAEREAMP